MQTNEEIYCGEIKSLMEIKSSRIGGHPKEVFVLTMGKHCYSVLDFHANTDFL
jgi:hypothetical protein